MSFVKEFKDFAMKGNVIDMAVGIIIGAAFGKIVSSLVADIFTPTLGLIIGGIKFVDLKITLNQATGSTLNYGMFLQTVFDFLIVAFAIFLMIKGLNAVKKKQAEAPAAASVPTTDQVLLTEIRDLLKK